MAQGVNGTNVMVSIQKDGYVSNRIQNTANVQTLLM